MDFISAREHSYTVNEDKKCEKKHHSRSIASSISKISPNTGSFASQIICVLGDHAGYFPSCLCIFFILLLNLQNQLLVHTQGRMKGWKVTHPTGSYGPKNSSTLTTLKMLWVCFPSRYLICLKQPKLFGTT